ncbi:MAG: hypothetical protein JWP64_3194, partial [Pseudonocardia sp.]|nr:hypothetical protein [Pseudonocardia sp.]
ARTTTLPVRNHKAQKASTRTVS